MLTECVFATYAALPGLDPDDRIAAAALERRNVRVRAGIWTDSGFDWAQTPMCVIRSTWDYPQRAGDFARWIDRVAAATALRNDAALVRWNVHKSYLRDLAAAGVPIVPTAWLERGRSTDLDALAAERDWHDVVVKPAFGAGTYGVRHVRTDQDARRTGQAHVAALLRDGDVLVQPFLASVATYPERALVFIGGAYSHAVTKQAFQALLPAGEAGELPVRATDEEIALAAAALRAAPGHPLYARVDLVRDDANAPCVIEVELIEPSLFFATHAPAAEAFADAIVAELAALEGAGEGKGPTQTQGRKRAAAAPARVNRSMEEPQ